MLTKVDITLRVSSESLSLVEMEDILGSKSTGGYNRGDKVSQRSETIRKSSLWIFDVVNEQSDESHQNGLLDDTLREALPQFQLVVERAKQIPDANVDLYAGIFSVNQLNCYIGNSTLKRLAELDLDLNLSGYTSTDDDGDE